MKKHLVILSVLLFAMASTIVFLTKNESRSLVDVPVAKATLDHQSVITDSDLEMIQVNESIVLDRIIMDPDQLVGRQLKYGSSKEAGMFFVDQDFEASIKSELDQKESIYLYTLSQADANLKKIDVGMTLDLHFLNSLNQARIVSGILVSQARVLFVYTNGGPRLEIGDQIAFAVTNRDLDYLFRAEELGRILPIVSSSSYNEIHEINPTDGIKKYIDDMTMQLMEVKHASEY